MSNTLDFGPRRRARRISLTPMIDVVFLLLIFFMLSSRFGMDTSLPVTGGSQGSGSGWEGSPRLIDITPEGVKLNGNDVPESLLGQALAPLMPEDDAAVIIRPQEDASLQRMINVMDSLNEQGFGNMIVIE